MELRFALSGSVLYTCEADCVPPVGTKAIIRTIGYKKGLNSGSLIRFPISAEFPPEYDYTETGKTIVYIDVNGYETLEEGPSPD